MLNVNFVIFLLFQWDGFHQWEFCDTFVIQLVKIARRKAKLFNVQTLHSKFNRKTFKTLVSSAIVNIQKSN